MPNQVLAYYEALERASAEMLEAARQSNWEEVMRIEGACTLLMSQLRSLSRQAELQPEEIRQKSAIMKRIITNDAQMRHLVEPWLEDLDMLLGGQGQRVLH